MSCVTTRRDSAGAGAALRACMVAAGVTSALLLAGCQTSSSGRPGALFGGGASNEITGSVGQGAGSFKATQKWAVKWARARGDATVARNYAAHLMALGSHQKAASVLGEAAAKNPGDAALTRDYGKQLARAGMLDEAERVLAQAQRTYPRDWTVISAHGTVLDGLARHREAQDRYRAALKLNPGQASILNNLGMSYALSGKADQAEAFLRKAAKADPKNVRVRQNLALAVGLQGRFEEAEKIASADLPANLAAANMQYLRSMLSQPNVWQSLKNGKASSSG